ncbi:nodulation protein NfeD [Ottowia sp.]|uniref:NfeD family protein n=1 Tax=Ottowia sp. TaxID=1898956 RepID=UPI002C02B935|nr:nodulation protein NfeD [Ottowia sp.]HRN74749.1 nodulation protein NfeD [Ottowia sp.]HRQ01901.1 nodulation protein NfeD [Ottowia sp.]
MMAWRYEWFRWIMQLLVTCSLCVFASLAWSATPNAVVLRIDGAISPASADYVVRGIEQANQQQAEAVVLEIDTPGGLADSMRDVIKAILASRVPVVGYVSPPGARAASAGTYILYASHVAAMAPATNIGAATPISLIGRATRPMPGASGEQAAQAPAEDTAMRKATNDAVAYIRALAEQRGRNADWAEKAVREAVSVSSEEALKLKVIDLTAPDVSSLLAAVDGRSVQTAAGALTLRTSGAAVERIEPDWRSQFLAVIANPSVAYLLLLVGLAGLVIEGTHPGVVLPGVVGAICLLLALYALQMLPVHFAGLGLILLGVILIASELFLPTYGVLGIGGVISFVIGSVVLMRSDMPGYGLALPTVVGMAIAASGVLAGIVWMALRSRRHPVVSGREQMIGAVGRVVADFDREGFVHVHGEQWQAVTDTPLTHGQRVAVTGMQGLVLRVRPATPSEETLS